MKTLGDLGEDPLIAKLCAGLPRSEDLLVGPGDDCAVIDTGKMLTLLKTDAVVEGVHFLKETPARKVGWKSVARVLSDFAAMGGKPGEFLITLALPKETAVRWVTDLYAGMNRCLAIHGGVIAGGETTALPSRAPAMISVSGRGLVSRKQLVTRSEGKPRDVIFVTGGLGGSITGKHLSFTPRLEEAEWLTENFKLRAMMDLSDGLAKDLPRLADMSGCGFRIDRDAVPRNRGCSVESALGDGEDFELVFTTSAQTARKLEAAWGEKFPKLALSRIGQLTDGARDKLTGGWGHFE
ncbi:thiamine-phosphate kinase [bacterium]|nr:thiamine-phosphate kinase [bacterium]